MASAGWGDLAVTPVAGQPGVIVMCDTVPGGCRAEARTGLGLVVRPERRFHHSPARPDSTRVGCWPTTGRRHAGDGYASVGMALWGPIRRRLVAYATQVMVFAFGA